jgi:dolichol kinase
MGPLLVIALAATALEQVAWLGIDNLTVPIVSAWLWSYWR